MRIRRQLGLWFVAGALSFWIYLVEHNPSYGKPSEGGQSPAGRLRTVGYEARGVAQFSLQDSLTFEGDLVGIPQPTIDTVTVRSGSNSLKCDSGNVGNGGPSNARTKLTSEESVLGRTYFLRTYVNVPHYPTTTAGIINFLSATELGFDVRLTSEGKLQLFDSVGGTQIGSDSAVLITNQWYRVELSAKLASGANDAAELRLDGVVVAGGSDLTVSEDPISEVWLGWADPGSPGANKLIYFDDVAWNDDQGATQNSWPGEGKIILLKPISDNQRGSWTGGGGGTANLFDGVNNTPPIGSDVETDLRQIKTNDGSGDNATDEYRANMTDYATAGLFASDVVTLCQAVVSHGEAVSAGTKTGAFLILSNPVQTTPDTFTFGDNAGAFSSWPVGWRSKWGQAQYSPSVTLTTSPVLRVRKTDTGTRFGHVDFMGIYVEYRETVPVMQPMLGLFSPILVEP